MAFFLGGGGSISGLIQERLLRSSYHVLVLCQMPKVLNARLLGDFPTTYLTSVLPNLQLFLRVGQGGGLGAFVPLGQGLPTHPSDLRHCQKGAFFSQTMQLRSCIYWSYSKLTFNFINLQSLVGLSSG